MRAGDLPTLKTGYTSRAVFSDGSQASHFTMTRLLREGRIVRPEGSSIHTPFMLAE